MAFDHFLDAIGLKAQFAQHTAGHAALFADQTEQQVLGANGWVMKSLSLLMGQAEHMSCTLGKPFQIVGHVGHPLLDSGHRSPNRIPRQGFYQIRLGQSRKAHAFDEGAQKQGDTSARTCRVISELPYNTDVLGTSRRRQSASAYAPHTEEGELTNPILTRCGYRCDLCLAYAPNIARDPSNQQKLSDGWYTYFGFRIPPDEIHCDGCLTENAKLIDTACPVRPCVIERGLENCAPCGEYVCARLSERIVSYDQLLEKTGRPIPADDYECFIRPYENKRRLEALRAAGRSTPSASED